jgi:NADPH-dependent 2,4-dienoyl-CoA reductase/sulfur reductase-like enzyme
VEAEKGIFAEMEYNIVSVEKAARDLRTQSTHDNHSRPHVLIVGAGITGLLLAQSLKKVRFLHSIAGYWHK